MFVEKTAEKTNKKEETEEIEVSVCGRRRRCSSGSSEGPGIMPIEPAEKTYKKISESIYAYPATSFARVSCVHEYDGYD